MSQTVIDKQYLNQIKSVIGYPKTENIILTDDEITEICVGPALKDYFRKFPLVVDQSFTMIGETTIDFPDDQTYGIVDIRACDVGGVLPGQGGSFWDVLAYQQIAGASFKKYSGAYGIKGYNPSNLIETKELYRMKLRSYQNTYTTIKFHIYPNDKKVVIYFSVTSVANISWAKFSNDFGDVLYQHINEVLDLAKANILLHLADSGSMLTDTQLETTINSDALKDRAEKLRDGVMTKWNDIPSIVYLHNI